MGTPEPEEDSVPRPPIVEGICEIRKHAPSVSTPQSYEIQYLFLA